MKKRLFLFLLTLLIFIPLCVPAHAEGTREVDEVFKKYNSKEYVVGHATGSSGYFAVMECLPDATHVDYSDNVTAYLAVQTGKIDAFAYDDVAMTYAIADGLTGVELLPGGIGDPIDIVVGISRKSKVDGLTEKVNNFIDELTANGTLDDMYNRWICKADDTMPDIPAVIDPSCKLVVGTTGLVKPFSYYEGATLTGYDLEFIKRLGVYLNAEIEMKVYDYGGIITAADGGVIDCIVANLNSTPERAEVIDFSKPMMRTRTTLMVKSGEGVNTDDLKGFAKLKRSFEKTFVVEDRWQLIANGLLVTVVISLFAGIFGIVLGFIICMMLGSRAKASKTIANIFSKIIQGMPIVVLLLILYYVIFASVNISAIVVSIIGFGIFFGVNAGWIMRSGMDSVDKGQLEAACALGYNKYQSFMKILLPQSAMHFLPLLRGEFIGMMKLTSIVGYIAVQDITKASDIIRARTMEAFFPLIVTAILYFLLANLLTYFLGVLEKKLDPKSRKRKIKGIEV